MSDMGRLGCMAGKWSPGVSVREIPLFSFGVGIMCGMVQGRGYKGSNAILNQCGKDCNNKLSLYRYMSMSL